MDADAPRAGWFVPHETTITLPDGSELTVSGIPYEGWGTDPGNCWSLATIEDDGVTVRTKRWLT